MVKCEIRVWYGDYGTCNFKEDRSLRSNFEVLEIVHEGYIALHERFGDLRKETPSYVSYYQRSYGKKWQQFIYYK